MAEDSHHFIDAPSSASSALYEAKMIHHFDHRWATFGPDRTNSDVTFDAKTDPIFSISPRYWVNTAELEARLAARDWHRGWLMGWRDICRSTDERTVIATVLPRVGLGNTLPMFMTGREPHEAAVLLANLSALVLDFVARQKIGGTHLTYGYLKQFPIFPPDRYTDTDFAFIVSRVLELTYTAYDLSSWAADLGHTGEPFPWNPERRAQLRAELDAYYGRLYGLTRDELRYILDPADVMGDDYPSETFRVLKNKEIREFGEYRTQRLVLEAWDRLPDLPK
jgi:hypothetical protein